MQKRIFCVILAVLVSITAFIPFAEADCTLYASDGRTLTVSDERVEAFKKVGWYETPEEAQLITMYATDGRTISIAAFHREAFEKVGWYNTIEEVTYTMYSEDGRSLRVFKDEGELYRQVGWFYNIEDVSVKMYDADGNEHLVFNANIEEAKKNGLTPYRFEVQQLMFAADGRIIYVPFELAEAYEKVGWYRGGGKLDPTRPMVALTFDDGPGKYTDRVLSCLEKYGVRATFFVQGKNVAGYKNTLKRAVELGCEIGNHTYSHVKLTASSGQTIASQISNTNTAVYNATGVYPKLYRPPYGAYNSSVLSRIAMPAIMWSVDTLDWKTRNAAKTLASVQKSTTDGAIILMHDIHSPTADAVETVVPYLLMQGYQLVTVSELIEARQGSIVNGRVYNKVKPVY